MILRARQPQHMRIADEIISYSWFWYHEEPSKELRGRLSDRTEPDLRDTLKVEIAAAKAALRELCEHIGESRVRIRGEFDRSKPPIDIHESECRIGKIYVWDKGRFQANTMVIGGSTRVPPGRQLLGDETFC